MVDLVREFHALALRRAMAGYTGRLSTVPYWCVAIA